MSDTYKCSICGYVVTGDNIPEICPVCGAPQEAFELEEATSVKVEAKAFRCLNCEYIHKGEEAPEICPVCGLSKEHFEPVEDSKVSNLNSTIKKIVILGGGIAGLSAAESIRERSSDVEILLITNEDRLPYYRLNLTRLMAKEIEASELSIHDQYWYDEQRIQVLKNRVVTEISRKDKRIELFDGDRIDYDRLIVAIGAHPFIPPIKGISQSTVTSIRSMGDVALVEDNLKAGDRCIIMGGGVLGLEAASALASQGIKVTVVEGSKWLMPRQLNQAASELVEKSLKDIGIEVVYEFKTKEVICEDDTKLIAIDGRTLSSDYVIVSTGVRANTYLLRMAGLEVNQGLVVDDYMCTSDPDIYAAGDITEHYGVVYGLWNIALYQGRIAGYNILGGDMKFGGVPRSNTLKVLSIDVFSIGEIVELDGSYELYEKSDNQTYIMFMLKESHLVGAIAIGYSNIAHKLKKAVEEMKHIPMDYRTEKEIFDYVI